MADLTEKSSRTPISDRVYNHIKSNIANGSWKPGDKIPSENILCKTLDVSRVSARAAIRKLTNMGILESYQGRGTFVCADAAFDKHKRYLPYRSCRLSRPRQSS